MPNGKRGGGVYSWHAWPQSYGQRDLRIPTTPGRSNVGFSLIRQKLSGERGGGLLFVIRGGNASKHLEYDPVRAALLPLADLAGDGSVQGVRRVGGVEAAAAVDDGVNQPRRHRGNVSGHQGVGGGRPVGLRWFRGARVVSAVLVAVVVVVVVGVGWFLTCGTVEASPNLPCRGSAYFF